jgi:Caspase domain
MKILAIVIGNNNYYENAKLDNAINDAKAIKDVFERLGYDIIYKEDCKIDNYIELLIEFESRIKSYDATIFYFAGHGFELDGENYLASIDCQIANLNKHHCKITCITLTEILNILKQNLNKVNIVIIDACRKSFERGGSNSFTPIQAPKGTLIAFSTSPNEGAKDNGIDGHSIYTGALLNYIGRERISVEDLFKKVRKTVYNLTEGKQTTWEHTSLIGDFYFNIGQLVYDINIPYDEFYIKDSQFKENNDDFSNLIVDLKSSNWNIQNPAIDKFLKIPPSRLDYNQQFLIGRNLLQASGFAHNATAFFGNLKKNLVPFCFKGENHILNGILFEMYFDKNGEFRRDKFKKYNFESIFNLRTDKLFKTSFDFLNKLLEPYVNYLYFIPTEKNEIIDIDIVANSIKVKNYWVEEELQVINKIKLSSNDITSQISRYGLYRQNRSALVKALSDFLFAPSELIKIHSNIELKKIQLIQYVDDDDLPF